MSEDGLAGLYPTSTEAKASGGGGGGAGRIRINHAASGSLELGVAPIISPSDQPAGCAGLCSIGTW
ncbi:MAG: hypothetical protein JXR83_09980 [Deltaproteobacteria bacterium]|nr:hypothetical protein [Deltaproteobacteria bacterium]